eukprot:3015095-Rhodomonas_salina.2
MIIRELQSQRMTRTMVNQMEMTIWSVKIREHASTVRGKRSTPHFVNVKATQSTQWTPLALARVVFFTMCTMHGSWSRAETIPIFCQSAGIDQAPVEHSSTSAAIGSSRPSAGDFQTDSKYQQAKTKAEMETEALMQKHNLSALRVCDKMMEGSPSKWKKQLMQASVHGEAVRSVQESIATELEVFTLYVKTKAEWKADPDDPQVEYMYKCAQLNFLLIMDSERGKLEFPDQLNLNISSRGRS